MSQLELPLPLQVAVCRAIGTYRYDETGEGWEHLDRPPGRPDEPWGRSSASEERIESPLLCEQPKEPRYDPGAVGVATGHGRPGNAVATGETIESELLC